MAHPQIYYFQDHETAGLESDSYYSTSCWTVDVHGCFENSPDGSPTSLTYDSRGQSQDCSSDHLSSALILENQLVLADQYQLSYQQCASAPEEGYLQYPSPDGSSHFVVVYDDPQYSHVEDTDIAQFDSSSDTYVVASTITQYTQPVTELRDVVSYPSMVLVERVSDEYRAEIARLSDNFLATATSLSGDCSPKHNIGILSNHGRKRAYDAIDDDVPTYQHDTGQLDVQKCQQSKDYVSEAAENASTSNTDSLPVPSMIVPSQRVSEPDPVVKREVIEDAPPVSEPFRRSCSPVMARLEKPTNLKVLTTTDVMANIQGSIHSHAASCYQQEQRGDRHPHHINKRFRGMQVAQASPQDPLPWVASTETVMKLTTPKKPAPAEKKQPLACLFCRERKIACGRPAAGHPDQTCNQCARRHICCEYPTESRRGQHKRNRRKLLEAAAAAAAAASQTA